MVAPAETTMFGFNASSSLLLGIGMVISRLDLSMVLDTISGTEADRIALSLLSGDAIRNSAALVNPFKSFSLMSP
jgi:hypothetical protein